MTFATKRDLAEALWVAVSDRRGGKASFFTVVVWWRDQAEHAAESLSRRSRVVVVVGSSSGHGRLRTAVARSTVEVVAEELGASLRWATATTTRTTRSQDR